MKFHPQSGIAIGPIIFLIAVLAIIGAAIAASAGFFTDTNSPENAKSWASVLINESDLIKQAVQRVVIENGCSLSQLDFTAPEVGFTINNNSSAPANGSCSIFNQNGGGLQYINMSGSSGNPTMGWRESYAAICAWNCGVAGSYYDDYPGFVQWYAIPGVSNNATLVVWWMGVDPNVCAQINADLGYTGSIPLYQNDNSGRWFTGSFTSGALPTSPQSLPAFFTAGPGMCYQEAYENPYYIFYYVLYPD
jgi:hypothetical protein